MQTVNAALTELSSSALSLVAFAYFAVFFILSFVYTWTNSLRRMRSDSRLSLYTVCSWLHADSDKLLCHRRVDSYAWNRNRLCPVLQGFRKPCGFDRARGDAFRSDDPCFLWNLGVQSFRSDFRFRLDGSSGNFDVLSAFALDEKLAIFIFALRRFG